MPYSSPLSPVGSDIQPLEVGTLTFTFEPQATSTVAFLSLVDDEILEDDEQFSVEIVSVTGGGRIGSRSSATVTILDFDSKMTYLVCVCVCGMCVCVCEPSNVVCCVLCVCCV